jgi:TPR repeat protein
MQTGDQAHDKRYEDATFAYGIGQFEAALNGFAELARSGHPMATAYLAHMYLRGEGVPPSVGKGLELLQLAASLGDSTAAFNLGASHRSGDCGVPKDPEKNRKYFLLAKEFGCKLSIEPYI